MDQGRLVFKRDTHESMGIKTHIPNPNEVAVIQMISMYDKVCAALNKPSADSSIIDLYTLYGFVSVILSGILKKNQAYGMITLKSINSINALRLHHAIENVDEDDLLSLFFDTDKIYYGGLNLAGAMDTAGYTPEEQALFTREATRLIAGPSEEAGSSDDTELTADLVESTFRRPRDLTEVQEEY